MGRFFIVAKHGRINVIGGHECRGFELGLTGLAGAGR